MEQIDPDAKTHISRKSQDKIDAMWSRCTVDVGSRLSVGSDHEVISIRYTLEAATRKGQTKVGGPRELKGEIKTPHVIDQDALERMAKAFTKPISKPRQRVPKEIMRLRRTARATRTPEAWKTYMSQLRKFTEECHSKKLETAASDWGEYRRVKKAAKTSWQHDFAAALDQEPVPHLRDHVQKKVRGRTSRSQR